MSDEITTFEDDVEEIVSLGLLPERQAEAYLLMAIMHGGREQSAEYMGVSKNTLDNHLRSARDKIEAAGKTLERLREIDERLHHSVPDDL